MNDRSLDNLAGNSPTANTRWGRLLTLLFSPVESSSLVVFRIGFGLILAIWAIDYLSSGRVHEMYVAPRFHFTYYLFHFVQPWGGSGMSIHFGVLCILALCIAAGFLYRITTILFAIGFTYVFLLERTNYQNHYYLVCLTSWLLVILPLNRAVSLDVLADLVRPSPVVPTWCLWLIRFHVALPYVFGGLAKFHPDWFAGEPLRTHLASRSSLFLIGPLLTSEVVVNMFIWGGLLFDLAIVPLLLWRRTRILAYMLCVVFHLLNAQLFNIHIFPWFMIVATTIFFEPDWPRVLCSGRQLTLPAPVRIEWHALSRWTRVAVVFAACYCLFHVTWPLRHHLYAGNSAWTERGHYFSWRMMLRAKVSAVRYYVTDTVTGETRVPGFRPYLRMEQVSKFSRDPEMILQFAHFLAHEYSRQSGHTAEVRALVLTSLNGRKPELLIDPNVDLAQQPLGFHDRPWIRPQTEPLQKIAWPATVPMNEWERHVKIPPLTFLRPAPRGSQESTTTGSRDSHGGSSLQKLNQQIGRRA